MNRWLRQRDDSPSIYSEMYAAGEEGNRHTAFLVRDDAAERRRLLDMGSLLPANCATAMWRPATSPPAVTGGFTELHTDAPRSLQSFAVQRRAHEIRRPDDSAVLYRR